MIIKTIPLHKDNQKVTLTAYIQEPNNEMPNVKIKPAILVVPGGGYENCSKREGEVVALQFIKEGYQAFVLQYSLFEQSRYPQPLHDGEAALELIKEHHKEWHLDPTKIAMIGFSAGAHLSTMVATSGRVRPNALIVGYPTLFRWPKWGFDYPLPVVDDKTPEAFIFHTYDDDFVPIKNSLYLANQYNDHKIPFDLHIFRDGKHGLSLGNRLVLRNENVRDQHYQQWLPLSIAWLDKVLQPFQ